MKPHVRLLACSCALAGAFGAWARAEAPPPAATAREFDVGEYHVRVDPSRQVIAIQGPADHGRRGAGGEPVLSPNPGLSSGGIVSASALARKAKQFDDGLYAAVDLAAQDGAGRFQGKAAWLKVLARALASGVPGDAGNVPGVLLSACRFGRVGVEVPAGLGPGVESAATGFLADALRSRPIGFYTWSDPLRDLFRQDRMLQTELDGAGGIALLARALQADPGARAAYEGSLALASRLTNPPAGGDLRAVVRALDRGRAEVPARGVSILPPSRSHEADLIVKLYGNRPIPQGFDLADEMIRRIRAGSLDLRPTPASGWYDHQAWALEPLVAPERAPEAARLRLDDAYRKQLLELFRGLLTFTRETHAKQLEIGATGAAPGSPGRQPTFIRVNPDLSAEPLATFYARRAVSYEFVRVILEEAFGPEGLRGMRRLTASGPVGPDLATELDQMIGLFRGASATVGRELGLAGPASPPTATSPARDDDDRAAFRRWAGSLGDDPDLGVDARMMVPVFYDRERRKTKVWAFLGWSTQDVSIRFATPPAVEVTRAGRRPERGDVEVRFVPQYAPLAFPVTAEVYVDEILDRDEFRRHCDRFKTRAAILENLR